MDDPRIPIGPQSALQYAAPGLHVVEKADGFPGQRIIVLPRPVVARAEEQPLLSSMIPTDVGYYPRALGHAFERPAGCDQAIVIYCLAGRGSCRAGSAELSIRSGEVLVLPPGVSHRYCADLRRPWTIHWFHAKGRLLSHYLEELGASSSAAVHPIGKDAQVVALFEEILDVVEHGYAFTQLLHAGQALSHLFALLVRRVRDANRQVLSTRQRIARSVAYMKQHLDAELDVASLARSAALSPSHYSALFKEHTGYSPIDYLARLRVHRACQLLDTSKHSVKTIAAQVGYRDQLYFSRVFRAVTEVSPSQYRVLRKG
jgi:AraC-like DNA-binding protein